MYIMQKKCVHDRTDFIKSVLVILNYLKKIKRKNKLVQSSDGSQSNRQIS